jgi:hypothetical protein
VRSRPLLLAAAALVLVLAGYGGSGKPSLFIPEQGVRIRDAVSAEAVQRPDGSMFLYANLPKGIEGFRSQDGLTFEHFEGRLPLGAHPAVISLPGGKLRMYYATPSDLPYFPSQVRSAVSKDGYLWFLENGIRLRDVGFGVMEVVALPDGSWRLYYNDRRPNGESRIVSARSTRGLTFHPEAGVRLPQPYADPAVVPLRGKGWLMAVATIEKGKRQRVFLAESHDGLSWKLDPKPLVAEAGASDFDPTLLPLPDGRFRLYYTRRRGTLFEVRSGIVERR